MLGKDILRFHAIIWPAMLMAAGYELPRQLYIHGYLLGHDGHRMSKTRGNGMDPYPAIDTYGADALRYYLLREVGFGQDGSVGYGTLHDRYHSELANELGNLVNRTIAMIERYRGGVVPDAPRRRRARGDRAIASRRASPRGSRRSTSRARSTRRGSSCARSTASSRSARRGSSPRATTAEQVARLDETLRTLADGIRVLGIVLLLGDARHLRSGCSRRSAPIRPTSRGRRRGAAAWQSVARVDSAAAQLFPRVESPPVAA